MALSIVLFAMGLFLLIKGADIFVNAAVFFSQKLHIPQMVVGATIVSIGTTLPEVMVSATAAMQHETGIAYGNAIGSVICNSALIGGLLIAIRPKGIVSNQFQKLFFLFAGSFVLYAFFFLRDEELDRGAGILLLGCFLLYMLLSFREGAGAAGGDPAPRGSTAFFALSMALGPACVIFGSHLAVDHATVIAEEIGISSQVIALTIVALGTSLPELVTSLTALAKGHSSLSLGNILGADILNLILVSPVAAIIHTTSVDLERVLPDLIFAGLSVALLGIPILLKKRAYRLQGLALLALYGIYTCLTVLS